MVVPTLGSFEVNVVVMGVLRGALGSVEAPSIAPSDPQSLDPESLIPDPLSLIRDL
jgi:hypothetical protein